MIIGVPKEIKLQEHRIGLTPDSVKALTDKNHEVLISKEEMLKASPYSKFYRITSDQRDLNYEKYFRIGNEKIHTVNEYSSANTKFLKVKEVIKLLKKQSFVKNELC